MASSDVIQREAPTQTGDGFMGFWANIDADYVLRYQEWHSCEHIIERVSLPGFAEGRRYRGVSPDPTFFMCYVTASPDTLRGKNYLSALDRPTPWTREALTHFRNPTRNIYRKLGSAERAFGGDPYAVLLRLDGAGAPQALLTGLAGWTGNAQKPIGASLYEIDSTASTIMTAERAIYAGGPGTQGRLLALGLRDRASADAALQHLTQELPRLGASNVEGGIYWLETRLQAIDIGSSATVNLENGR